MKRDLYVFQDAVANEIVGSVMMSVSDEILLRELKCGEYPKVMVENAHDYLLYKVGSIDTESLDSQAFKAVRVASLSDIIGG